MRTRNRCMAAGLLLAACGAATSAFAQPIALDYNWNAAAHPGEQNMADAPDGYRSISDRGWKLGEADSLGGTGFTVSLNAGQRVYQLPQNAGETDVVFIGSRDQNGGNWDGSADGDDIGVQPNWDPTGGSLTVQTATSTFAPIALGEDDAVGFLLQASNGGGDFDITLGFSDGDSVTVTTNAPDWFANNNPGDGERGFGVAFQSALPGPLSSGDGFAGTENVDLAADGAPLNAVEVVITRDVLLDELGFDFAGKSLNSITFESPLPDQNTRVITIAASVFAESAVTPQERTLPRIGIMVPPEITLPTRSPNLVDKNGKDFFGFDPLGPGEFPDRLVVGKWEVAVSTTPESEGGLGLDQYTLDTANSEYIMAKRILSGPAPFYWTSGAANEGDIDINIGGNPDVLARQGGLFAQPLGSSWNMMGAFGPAGADPTDAFNDNGFRFEALGNSGDDIGAAEPNYAWAVGLEAGVPIFSAAQNAVQNGQVDQAFGPLETLYGTTGTSFGGRRGKGYSMVDGFIAGIGGGETSARTSIYAPFGAAGIVSEFAFDTGCWWFPFAEGWAGGAIISESRWRTEDNGEIILRSPLLGFDGQGISPNQASFDDASNVVTPLNPDRAYGEIALPGTRSPENGMIFLTSSAGNQRDLVGVLEGEGKWTYLAHPDDALFPDPESGEDFDIPEANDGTSPEDWASDGSTLMFVYVSYNQPNLIGGKINADGTIARAANEGGFSVNKIGTGQYEVTIAGESGTQEEGVLLLQSLNPLLNDASLPGRTYFTYEYSNGSYLVEARRSFVGDSSGDVVGNNADEAYVLVDAPFYLMYSDFVNPPAASLADFDGNGAIEPEVDLPQAIAAIQDGYFEVNNDGRTNFFDALRVLEEKDAGF